MAADTYEVSFLGGICGQPVANVLHFTGAATSDPNPIPACEALLTLIGDGTGAGSYSKLYLDCLPVNYTLLGTRCRRINNGGGPKVANVFTPAVGTRTGDSDVSGIGPVGLWHGNFLAGPWRTGKIFFPGVSTLDVQNNSFTTSLKTAILAFIELWEVPLGAGPLGPFIQVIWSPKNSEPVTILEESISLKVGTQRRRYVPL